MMSRKLVFAVALWATMVGMSVAWGQEFPEDELVAEQVVVVAFRTGLINRGKIRQIYKHVETVPAGYKVIREPVNRQVSSLYTYLPHPVVEVESRVPKWEVRKEYRALPSVGVRASSSGGSSTRTRRTIRRR